MLGIPLIGRQIDSKGQQCNCIDIRVGEEDHLEHIVHAVSVGQGVTDANVGRQQVQDVYGDHPVGTVLGQQVHEFWDQVCFLHPVSGVFVEGEIVVYE